jgi:Ca-activated chloride channel homolog
MFNPQAYENSGPEGISVLEIVDGEQESEARRFVPLKRTGLRGEVTGPLASLCLTHVYGYSREQCDQVLEAVYRFPLPGDAAITGARVRFGSVEIATELKEREAAEAEYGKAKKEGRQAALLTQEAPSVFTLHVAGIEPDQDVTVETSYVQLARAEGSGWNLRVPLTTSPRYVRADERDTRQAQAQPLALLRDPGHRFSLDLAFADAGTVQSPTHALDLSPGGDPVRVRLQDGEVLPDRDCVLTWQPRQERDRPAFHVWLHDDGATGQASFLALVAPPAVPDPGLSTAREVIMLVDHSGSMEGAKWEATDWAVRRFLSDLTERDTFNLGLFHNTTRWFSKVPRRADPPAVEEAIRFLEEHRDSGGTELGVALEQALHQQRAPDADARHVLVLTDAEVTDAGRVLRLADEEAARDERRRVSVLCIDAAPNSHLALELAERGGGIARFLTSDPDEEDIATALDAVLADWAQPVLAGLVLEVDRPQAQAAGRAVRSDTEEGHSRIDLGDLPTGRALWVAGRVPRGEATDLTFRVLDDSGREVKTRRMELNGDGGRPAIPALVSARRLLSLESLMQAAYEPDEMEEQLRRLGFDPSEVLSGSARKRRKVYSENALREGQAALRRLLVQESLATGLLSSETAFVAVRTEQGKPVERSVVVANALPAGWSTDFLSVSFGASAPRRATRGGGVMYCRAMAADTAAPQAMFYGSAPMAAAPAYPQPRAAGSEKRDLFNGVPAFTNGEAVLFDSSTDEDRLGEWLRFSCLHVEFVQGAPAAASVDPGLALLLFVGDPSQPRARVRLTDLIAQGGQRPLNLTRHVGQQVRIVLVDPNGAWATNAPALRVALA